jgi:hypothetical protein
MVHISVAGLQFRGFVELSVWLGLNQEAQSRLPRREKPHRAGLVSCPDLSDETFSRSGVSMREVWIGRDYFALRGSILPSR